MSPWGRHFYHCWAFESDFFGLNALLFLRDSSPPLPFRIITLHFYHKLHYFRTVCFPGHKFVGHLRKNRDEVTGLLLAQNRFKTVLDQMAGSCVDIAAADLPPIPVNEWHSSFVNRVYHGFA